MTIFTHLKRIVWSFLFGWLFFFFIPIWHFGWSITLKTKDFSRFARHNKTQFNLYFTQISKYTRNMQVFFSHIYLTKIKKHKYFLFSQKYARRFIHSVAIMWIGWNIYTYFAYIIHKIMWAKDLFASYRANRSITPQQIYE